MARKFARHSNHRWVIPVLIGVIIIGIVMVYAPGSGRATSPATTPNAKYLPLVSYPEPETPPSVAVTPSSTGIPVATIAPTLPTLTPPLSPTDTPTLTPTPTNTPTPTGVPVLQHCRAGTIATFTPFSPSRPSPDATATTTPSPTAGATEPNRDCPVYPIGILSELLDSSGFVPPTDPTEYAYYGFYSDETMQNHIQRRLYLQDNASVSGGYVHLGWDGLTMGSTEFAEAFIGEGNLAERFAEADWPEGVPGKPEGYPVEPNVFTAGDWVYGLSGLAYSNELRAALQYHIDNHTIMTLPIVRDSSYSGNHGVHHVSGFGHFLLRGFGTQPGRGWYLDMVYVGTVSEID